MLAGAGKVVLRRRRPRVDGEDGRATREDENLRDATAMSRDVRARSTRCRCRSSAASTARRSAAAPASPRSATSSSPTSDAVFGFTEVKLGILPAVDLAVRRCAKIGRSAARELFLTGARFSAARAQEIGLVHAVVPAAELDAAVARYVDEIC